MGEVWSTPIEFLGKRQVTDSNVPARCGGSWPLVAAPPLLSLRGATFAVQRTPGLTVQTVRRSSAPCTVRGPGHPRASCVGGLWVVFCLSFRVSGRCCIDTNASALPHPPPPLPPSVRFSLVMYRFACARGAGWPWLGLWQGPASAHAGVSLALYLGWETIVPRLGNCRTYLLVGKLSYLGWETILPRLGNCRT